MAKALLSNTGSIYTNITMLKETIDNRDKRETTEQWGHGINRTMNNESTMFCMLQHLQHSHDLECTATECTLESRREGEASRM